MTPRIPPLPASERDDDARELLDRSLLPDANIFTTLVRHPRLFRRWLPFGGTLLTGALPARDREILILRTGWNCGCEYEWSQHVRIGRDAGLSDDEIRRLRTEGAGAEWGAEAVLVRAADELHAGSRLSEATWSELAGRYDTSQLIEVPMVVGQYHLVAMTLNSLGVELDEGLQGFEAP